jgi:hypothetical protein
MDKKLFRFHHGRLEESMETIIEFKDYDDLMKKISDHYKDIFPYRWRAVQHYKSRWHHMKRWFIMKVYRVKKFDGEEFKCLPYFGIDERIGWDTHLIILDGEPIGMTNCKIDIDE